MSKLWCSSREASKTKQCPRPKKILTNMFLKVFLQREMYSVTRVGKRVPHNIQKRLISLCRTWNPRSRTAFSSPYRPCSTDLSTILVKLSAKSSLNFRCPSLEMPRQRNKLYADGSFLSRLASLTVHPTLRNHPAAGFSFSWKCLSANWMQ